MRYVPASFPVAAVKVTPEGSGCVEVASDVGDLVDRAFYLLGPGRERVGAGAGRQAGDGACGLVDVATVALAESVRQRLDLGEGRLSGGQKRGEGIPRVAKRRHHRLHVVERAGHTLKQLIRSAPDRPLGRPEDSIMEKSRQIS